jgi:signal transduction histidine kinase
VGGFALYITERKRMEHALREAVRTREELLAVVSHDLRSPLGTVQLSASMVLGEATLDHRQRRHLEMIHHACARMEHLIDDLLDSASIRAGQLQLQINREPASAIVAEALDLQRPGAEEKGVVLVAERDLADVAVPCDRDRILQVFANLIGNAIKFCRAGDTITVDAKTVENDLVFSVRDTGPGIEPDVRPFVFERYWSATEHATIGSGLGLYISRGIVERHGGRIWLESAAGEGAKFLFAIPLAR